MNTEYQKALKESSFAELFMAHQRLAGRRNIALFVGVIALGVTLWVRWSMWTLVVPVVIWFAAASQHAHLKLVQHEIRERKLKSETQSEHHVA